MRKSVKLKGINWLNKVLMIAQFSFSIIVLIAGYTFSQNADFLDEFNFGYEDESIYDLQLGSNEHYYPIKQKVEQIPGVVTVGTKNHFGNFGRFSDRTIIQIDTAKYDVTYYMLGEEYLDFMQVELIAGRSFIAGSIADQDQSIIVNNTFGEQYFPGKNPINQVVKIDGDRKTIVGICVDIIDNLYEDSRPEPIVYALADSKTYTHLLVKVENNDMKLVEDNLKDIWRENIDKPYNGHLQKDVALGPAGRDTKNLQKIFLGMAILGCFLSIVGIFSLASLNVAKRNKEISIRKVLGASLKELLLIVNRSFVIVLLIAMTFGVGLGYFLSDAVLSMIYKYYVDISILNSFLTGLLIIVISGVTITTAAFRPASANPTQGLREE